MEVLSEYESNVMLPAIVRNIAAAVLSAASSAYYVHMKQTHNDQQSSEKESILRQEGR